MSNPLTTYRISWQAFHESTSLLCYVDISDQDNLTDNPTNVINLTPSGNPARLSVIDNDEDPFTPVRAQQLTLRFLSDNNYSANTFMSGTDNRWLVHYYLGDSTNTIFKGYLVMDDISEAFLAPVNEVTLTATDGLGLLRDIKLVNADGENPQGHHRISDYLSWALRRTGLELDMRVAFNIKRSDLVSDISVPNSDAEHFFYTTFLEAKTFEDEIGTSVDCRTAIEWILGEEACLFQMWGMWWVMRVDEVEDATRGLYVSSFDSSGSFVANLGEIDFEKEINKYTDIFFADAATTIGCYRPNKSVRLNFMYETPREIPCNVDFSRGDNEVVISATEKNYDLECWTLRAGFPGSYISVDGCTSHLTKIYDANGYETERYVVLTPRTTNESGSSQPTYLESEPIPVSEKDKVNVSVDFRLNLGIASGGGNYRMLRLILEGDDGSYWILGRRNDFSGTDDTVQWYDTAGWTTNTGRGITVIDFDTFDEEEWHNLLWEAPPMPVDGNLYIWLNQFNQNSSSDDDKQIWYSGLSVEYIPFINSSYQIFTGQYHQTSQTPAVGEYKAKREKQVYISDSPKKLFKGALFKFDGSNYVLITEGFYNAAVFPGGPPSADYIHPYGEIQLYDVWNQFKNEMRKIEGTLQGIDLDATKLTFPYTAHLINKWNASDTSPHTSNRFFILLSFDQDHNSQGWTGVFREVVDTTVSKDYLNHEFKYVS